MIQYKYRHLWKKCNYKFSITKTGNKKHKRFYLHYSIIDVYFCEKCKRIENNWNITQYLPNCTISENEWIIKNIIE